MAEDVMTRVETSRERLEAIRGYFDVDSARKGLADIEAQMSSEGFWNDPARAQEIGRRRSILEKRIAIAQSLESLSEEVDVLLELRKEGEQVSADIDSTLDRLEEQISEVEITMKLSGEYDERNCIIAIHPGAGGTESQDWADMLLRMILRYCERKGFQTEMIDYQAGEEAGIKSVTFAVKGEHAYGYLRSEHGVHRLVRISPYDANKRRHTSFASIHVYPEIDDDIEVEINDKDLRIDTYRSSGAGGQHVNVTDSAVRITHLPTGIVVACQNERSQGRNRETAMKVLRMRLHQVELEKRKEEQKTIEGEKREIGFGSQIRSYVLQPYQLVKDVRTGFEVGDVQRVLDGDLDPFVEAWLGAQAKKSADETAGPGGL
ncbi:MAG TPA: peptide chain release factor 2 [Thermoanaerobaculia bacterium]|nr:peptide chain release factor 2 [Thermoanaerobaculia bacterium]